MRKFNSVRLVSLGGAAALTLALCLGNAHAAVLYSQAWDGSPNAQASQNDTISYGNFATVYDNFQLNSTATLTSVSFTGLFFNGSPAPITGWSVQIYGNNAGQPGSSLYAASLAGNDGSFANPAYSYTLPVSFTAQANQTYWLALVPSVGFPPQWGWGFGQGGDTLGYQDFLGSRSQLPNDFAFTLYGGASNSVPEPASLLLIGAAIAGLGLARRRRRKG